MIRKSLLSFLAVAALSAAAYAQTSQMTPVIQLPDNIMEDDHATYAAEFHIEPPSPKPVRVWMEFAEASDRPMPHFEDWSCVVPPNGTCSVRFVVPDDHIRTPTDRWARIAYGFETYEDGYTPWTQWKWMSLLDHEDALLSATFVDDRVVALAGDLVGLTAYLPQPRNRVATYTVTSSDDRVATLVHPIVDPKPIETSTTFDVLAASPGVATLTMEWSGRPYKPSSVTVVVFDSTIAFGSDQHVRIPLHGHADLPVVLTPPPPELVQFTVSDTTPGIVTMNGAVPVDANGQTTIAVDAKAIGTTQLELRTPSGRLAGVATIDVTSAIEFTSIAPTRGPASGGTNVTIRGEGFLPPCSVRFGDVLTTGAVGSGGTSITVVTPASVEGVSDVSVTCNGETAQRENAFEFIAPPARIRSVRH